MACAQISSSDLFRPYGLVLAVVFALSACGESENDDGRSSGGSAGQSGAGGRAAGGQPATAGQSLGGSQPAVAGQNTAGGQLATGGQHAAGQGGTSAGTGGTALGATGGLSSGGASGGATPSGGVANGDAGRATNGGGGAGASTGGASGSGGASSGECTRALLDRLLDEYFAALSAGDPSGLPLAADVKFTENAEESPIGKTEFWMNAGETKHSQRALDTSACSVAAQAVIPEGGMDLPVAVRIKVEDGKMTEIETIVVRPGDYTASFAVDSNPGAIIAIADDIGWHEEVPQAERATRQQLTSWIDKYFRSFPSGVCNVTAACRRLENGGGNFSCGESCSANTPTSGGELVPRVILVDEVRGIAAGFTIFDFQTTGHLDMHMIKMSGGEVHAVHAILRDTKGESGWD